MQTKIIFQSETGFKNDSILMVYAQTSGTDLFEAQTDLRSKSALKGKGLGGHSRLKMACAFLLFLERLEGPIEFKKWCY